MVLLDFTPWNISNSSNPSHPPKGENRNKNYTRIACVNVAFAVACYHVLYYSASQEPPFKSVCDKLEK